MGDANARSVDVGRLASALGVEVETLSVESLLRLAAEWWIVDHGTDGYPKASYSTIGNEFL